jgi:hypothetical protein
MNKKPLLIAVLAFAVGFAIAGAANEYLVTIPSTGTVSYPSAVDVTSNGQPLTHIDWGENLACGETYSLDFNVTNVGNMPLNVTLYADNVPTYLSTSWAGNYSNGNYQTINPGQSLDYPLYLVVAQNIPVPVSFSIIYGVNVTVGD